MDKSQDPITSNLPGVSTSPNDFFSDSITFLLYETSPEEHFTQSLKAFLETSQTLNGVNAIVVGSNSIFNGFGSKYAYIRESLVTLSHDSPDSLVVVLDARDTLLNVAVNTNVDADTDFRKRIAHYIEVYTDLTSLKPGAVVLSAETQCCVSAMSWAHPASYFNPETGERDQFACDSGADNCEYEDTENIDLWIKYLEDKELETTGIQSDNSFLNAGMMAGKASKLVELIDRVNIQEYEDDQAVLSGFYCQFPEFIVLDYKQQLFGNNEWTNGFEEGCVYDYTNANETSYLEHKRTAAVPLILHTSGKFYECLDYLREKLGGQSEKRFMDNDMSLDEEDEEEEDMYSIQRELKKKNYGGGKKKAKSSKKRRLVGLDVSQQNEEMSAQRELKKKNYGGGKKKAKSSKKRRLVGLDVSQQNEEMSGQRELKKKNYGGGKKKAKSSKKRRLGGLDASQQNE